MPAGSVDLRLQRQSTDTQTTPVVVWEGVLELHDGTGLEVLDALPIDYPCDGTSL